MIRYIFSIILTVVFSSASFAAITADFTPEKNSGIPKGWQLKEWKGKGEISIENKEGIPFIHLKSSKNSFALHKELNFNIKEYPVITWRWKVSRLPDGADVRNKKADDQAAQLYIVFPRFPAMINSRLIGYIWDTSAPTGSFITSKKNPNTKYIVIQSGKENLGEWIAEKRNVYEDYKMLFNEEPPAVGKISVMIDSDDTKSSAESFFSAIRFEKEPVLLAEAPKPVDKKDALIDSADLASKEPLVSLENNKDNSDMNHNSSYPDTAAANKAEKIKTRKSRLTVIKSSIIPQSIFSVKSSQSETEEGDNSNILLSIAIFILIPSVIIIAFVFIRSKDNIKK